MIRGMLSANRFFISVSLFQANEGSFSTKCTYSQCFESYFADYSVNNFPRNEWDLLSNVLK